MRSITLADVAHARQTIIRGIQSLLLALPSRMSQSSLLGAIIVNVAIIVDGAILATIALRLRAYYDVSQTLVLLEINFPDKCVFLLTLMSQSDRSRKCQKDINYHIEDKLLSGCDSIVLLEIIIRQHLSSMFH